MKNYIDAARSALESRNSYAALVIALTMPDICGAIAYPKAKSGDRYKSWWEKYCEPAYTMNVMGITHVFLGGADAYALRCAVLHQGVDDVTEHKSREALDRFKFIQPANGSIHNIQNGRHLLLQVDHFVEDICIGVEDFCHEIAGDHECQLRLGQLLEIDNLSNGLAF